MGVGDRRGGRGGRRDLRTPTPRPGSPVPRFFLWAWGLGGIVGALPIGLLIDRASSATQVMPVVIGLFVIATAAIAPAGGNLILVVAALGCWGAAGFASPPPQQHLLLERVPDRGAVAVAVNGSAIYLGSAIGSALGGMALNAGLPMRYLPPSAAAIATVALIGYLILVRRTGSR